MTGKEFMKRVGRAKRDLLEEFVKALNDEKISFCVIGGLAVNAYAEPVVSLDLDIVIVMDKLDDLIEVLGKKYKVKRYANSVNVSTSGSDLRVQIQTDARYQGFIKRASRKDVLGYSLPVARIEDVMMGKVWAAEDETRRPSKRQKDLADILRLLEAEKHLISLIPQTLKKKLEL